MKIVISEPGISIGKTSQRLVLKKDGKVIVEKPFSDIESVYITSHGISLSSDFIFFCCKNRIPINFLSSNGEPFAEINSPYQLSKAKIRKLQLEVYDKSISGKLAKIFIYSKLRNQINLLRYFAKSRRNSNPDLHTLLYKSANSIEMMLYKLYKLPNRKVDDIRHQIFNIEGISALYYWKAVKELLPKNLKFPGRVHYSAPDLFNSALNYGYGILYTKILSVILQTGLDPYTGYLHTLYEDKLALVYDFAEEFRTMIVDRPLIAIATKNFKFEFDSENPKYLNKRTKDAISKYVLQRLDDRELYHNKKVKLSDIMLHKAYEIVNMIRGKSEHAPYIGRW